ncbi:MAG: cation:proton antiporter [Chloroflexi bacterium]|nr:cation:proton antiporter [Chloroflexota bacterium]
MDNTYFIAAAWVGLALLASLVSIRLGISVALIEIALGVVGGNVLGLGTTSWIDFLALFGSVLLTFLAGAEIDPSALRRHLGRALAIGSVSFALPAAAAFLFALVVAGWDLHAAEIAGIALSTTSVAVVYAVMIETGLATQEIGKLILAACFVTDLGTVLALGVLFAEPGPGLVLFVAITGAALLILPRVLAWLIKAVPDRASEPEIKFVLLVLLALGGLATAANSEAVLPAYLIGLAFAGVFVRSRVLVNRMRAIAFSLLTPFYFIKAGLLVSLPAVAAGAGLIVILLLIKVGAKTIGVWPVARFSGMAVREASYTTLLMSTGLTFGTISALFGLRNGLIDQPQYTILVTTVILSAVVPTLLATTFFEPQIHGSGELEEVAAADEIDAGLIRHPRVDAAK